MPPSAQLDYARRDAISMREMLIRSYGFLAENITLLLDEDATRANIEEALNRFTDKRFIRPTDRLFVYFSGHGQTITYPDGQTDGFLIPFPDPKPDGSKAVVDLDKPSEISGYLKTCVSMMKVRTFLEDSPARCCLVAADACFSGFLVHGKGGVGGRALNVQALAALIAEPAYQVLTAGGRGQRAWEDPKLQHSVFTYALLNILKQNAVGEGNVLLTTELGADVKRTVLKLSNGRQIPQSANLRVSEGEFLFVATAPRPVPEGHSGLSALAASANRVMGKRVQAVNLVHDGMDADKRNDYVEAERLYWKAIDVDSQNSDAYYNLGFLYQVVKKDYVKAEELYRNAIKLNPQDSSHAYNNLGNVYIHLNRDYVEAEKCYRKAIELDPQIAQPHNGLGNIYARYKSDYVEAERLFRRAIELDPQFSMAYTNLGNLYILADKDDVETERLFRKAIELDPQYSDAYSGLGAMYYFKKHDYVESERLYSKAIELDPQNSMAYQGLGNISMIVKKDYVEAERLYRKSIKLNPNNKFTHIFLAYCLLQENRRDEALVEARRAKELGLKTHRVFELLGL